MVEADLRERLLNASYNSGYSIPESPSTAVDVNALGSYIGAEPAVWGGDKFFGGFGITKDYEVIDHYLLRKRSKQLFTENLYARGLLRRLLTNEINKGLALEATPDASLLGFDPEELAEWAELTERRFHLYGKDPLLCDYRGLRTMGAITRQARLMALVSGDVLVLLRQGRNGLPQVDLIDAECVADPESDTMIRAVTNRGNKLESGVEVDKSGKHVAFFVRQENGTYRRITANGRLTGRHQAWLFYGTERMIDDVRGQPLLAIVLQSLKELDRYRDAEQRAAVINAMIAMWIEKTEDKPSSLPMQGGATRRDTVTTQNDSSGRKDVTFSQHMPGMMLQELQTGEKPQSYDTRRPNVNYSAFEAATLSAIAWANEIPPETLLLQFQNNYAASRGATNEFLLYLDRIRHGIGEELLTPIYVDYLISDILNSGISAPGFLEAWRTRTLEGWLVFSAWTSCDWAGAIKPNVDLLKQVNAYIALNGEGWITRDRASRELSGMKYSKVVQQLKSENMQLADAIKPLIDAGLIKNENPDNPPIAEESEQDESNDLTG